jgi:hypothetical protein
VAEEARREALEQVAERDVALDKAVLRVAELEAKCPKQSPAEVSDKLDEIAKACQRGLSDNPGWTARRQVAQIRAALREGVESLYGETLAETQREMERQRAAANELEAEAERLKAAVLEIITRHNASLCDPCTCEADVLAALRCSG